MSQPVTTRPERSCGMYRLFRLKTCENLPVLAIRTTTLIFAIGVGPKSTDPENGNSVCESLRRRRAIRGLQAHGQPAAMQQIELNRRSRSESRTGRSCLISQTVRGEACSSRFGGVARPTPSRSDMPQLSGETASCKVILPPIHHPIAGDHQLFGLKYHHHLSVRVRNIRFHCPSSHRSVASRQPMGT